MAFQCATCLDSSFLSIEYAYTSNATLNKRKIIQCSLNYDDIVVSGMLAYLLKCLFSTYKVGFCFYLWKNKNHKLYKHYLSMYYALYLYIHHSALWWLMHQHLLVFSNKVFHLWTLCLSLLWMKIWMSAAELQQSRNQSLSLNACIAPCWWCSCTAAGLTLNGWMDKILWCKDKMYGN